MVSNFDVRAIWRSGLSKLKTMGYWVKPVWHQTPLFYVTILTTLCIKGLRSAFTCMPDHTPPDLGGDTPLTLTHTVHPTLFDLATPLFTSVQFSSDEMR